MFSFLPADQVKTLNEALLLAGFPMSCPENGHLMVVVNPECKVNMAVNVDGRFWSHVGSYCSLYSWAVAMQDSCGLHYESNLGVAVVVDYWGSEGANPFPYEQGAPKGLKTIVYG